MEIAIKTETRSACGPSNSQLQPSSCNDADCGACSSVVDCQSRRSMNTKKMKLSATADVGTVGDEQIRERLIFLTKTPSANRLLFVALERYVRNAVEVCANRPRGAL